MHKVIKMRYQGGTYEAAVDGFCFCQEIVQEYFDVEDRDFELHFSDRRPRDEEYYTVYSDADPEHWQLWDVEDGFDDHPWFLDNDRWATEHFGKLTDQIYVWVTDA